MKTSHHIVKAFDSDLETLSDITLKMLAKAQKMLESSIDALAKKNAQKASDVVADDDAVDQLEISGDDLAIKLIATRQPMADDLRQIISAMKVNNDIERIADYASNIAKKTQIILKEKQDSCIEKCCADIILMAKDVARVGDNIIRLIKEPSSSEAIRIQKYDKHINEQYADNLTKIAHCMQNNNKNAQSCVQFIFIAKELERIGDHFKNIAEAIYYRVEGVALSKHESTAHAERNQLEK